MCERACACLCVCVSVCAGPHARRRRGRRKRRRERRALPTQPLCRSGSARRDWPRRRHVPPCLTSMAAEPLRAAAVAGGAREAPRPSRSPGMVRAGKDLWDHRVRLVTERRLVNQTAAPSAVFCLCLKHLQGR